MAGAAPVIAGFGGGLISHTYLEEEALPALERARIAVFERRFARWWERASASLGPASSVRAIADVAVLPLLEVLEIGRPALSALDGALIAPMPAIRSILLINSWADTPDSIWRQAVRAGVAERHSWAIVCNGRSLRIIDCTRSWSRAAIHFDFEQLVLSPKGVTVLWMLARALAGSAASLRQHVDASDARASRVCRSLGDGVLAALPALATALAIAPRQHVYRSAAFDQSLMLVYRILFLLFAEARALVPVWNDVYRDAYTVEALLRASQRSPARADSARLWKSFQAISRLAHAGCRAGDLDVTAFNGRLFSPRHAPLVEQRKVSDAVMREVLQALATEQTAQGRRRISYHDLGVEQLGSVYERVLEHEPSWSGAAVVLTRTSQQRKSTGSFYTPQALTEFLVRRTLAPVVDGRSADQILRLRVVDPAMGSGAFLVAACVYLAECCEHALIRDGRLTAAEVTTSDRASLRRQVAERCLYGVDLNPTAVQLSRLSLWLTTLAADRPLTFLDHHLAAGNSLIGARLGDLSRPPGSRTGSSPVRLPLFDDQNAEEVSARVLPVRLRLSTASDSIAIVKDKERAMQLLASQNGPLAKWSAAADAWCAATLWPGPPPSAGVVGEWIAAATGSQTTLPAGQLSASLQRAREIAASHSAFHWELAFPEVFFDAGGHPAADGGFDAVIGNPPWSIVQASKGYRSRTTGHPNSYQLFLDRALQLARRGGRIGLILPSGIATDHGSAALRRRLLERTTIDTWIGFDNRSRIFPIHRSVRFVVLATSNAGSTEALRFRCGLTDVADLDRDGEPLSVSRSRIAAWSPRHLTIPEVTNRTALGILAGISDRVPALGDRSGWNVHFGRELNATDDRHSFVPLGSRRGLLPIVEGKQLSPFRIDVNRSTHGVAGKTARERIAYREVASATNKLTLIAAMLPANVISTHTVFCLKTNLDRDSQWCLLALLNSLAANYLVRLNVTTHVTAAAMSRLRVPRPVQGSRDFARLVSLARSLASTGVDANVTAYAALNALAARLYGLTRDEYAFILDTFPLIPKLQRECCLAALAPAT
ncbi:MAG TPA: N-6 DNA methylase [Vicinamibacterales bacterium]